MRGGSRGTCPPTLTNLVLCPTKVGGIAKPQSKLGAHVPAAPFPFSPSFPTSVKRDLLPSVIAGHILTTALKLVLVLCCQDYTFNGQFIFSDHPIKLFYSLMPLLTHSCTRIVSLWNRLPADTILSAT